MNASPSRPSTGPRRIPRLIEFVVLYAGIPLVLSLCLPPRGLLPVLWAFALVAWIALRADASFDRRRLCAWCARGVVWRRIVPQVLLAALALGLALAAHRPELLFRFPRARPRVWLLVLALYPLLSVYPQALLYRALYAHRYAPLFRSRTLRRGIGAAVFSLAHLPFGNGWALGFTLVGGWLFLGTYERTGSLPLSCLEHALYGDLLFTIGWGAYLYHGGTQALLAN